MPLVEAAVRIHPGHVAALGLLAERALEDGDVSRGLDLLELQAQASRDPEERALRFERVADAILSELNDTTRGRPTTIRRWRRRATRRRCHCSKRRSTCSARADASKSRRRRRRASSIATHRRRSGPSGCARRRRSTRRSDARPRRVSGCSRRLEIDPLDHETLAGLSAMLVQEGKDDEAAQLLTRALPLLPPPTPGLRAARASLWMRLGECARARA